MSMMDTMNQGGGQPPQGQAPQGQPPQGGAPQGMDGQAKMRMGEDGDLQGLFNRVMSLISENIWQGDGADQVAAQLTQQESVPAEVIGKFTGFYLMLVVGAAAAKGGMLPPVVVAGAAGQTASQLTDIALMLELVSPEQADDTADAGALIGMEVLLQNVGQQMAPDERQEYMDVLTALVKASPEAQAQASEAADEAGAEAMDMLQGQAQQADSGGAAPTQQPQQPPQQGGMAAMMGGQ